MSGKRRNNSRISTRSWLGVLGVAGTLLAFLLRHVVWQRCIGGSSFRSGPASSRTSFSVLPVYLNLYPQEKMEPPLTTGASDALGKLRTQPNRISLYYLPRLNYSNFGLLNQQQSVITRTGKNARKMSSTHIGSCVPTSLLSINASFAALYNSRHIKILANKRTHLLTKVR